MTTTMLRAAAVLLLPLSAHLARAQGTPTSQPTMLNITRELVKVGHAEEHARTEAGWPAAYTKAKSPENYLALVSMTGRPEAWYVTAYASHAAIADGMKREAADPLLSAELGRLSRADAAHLDGISTVQAVGRPDLSVGPFPDLGLVRFFQVLTFRVRPGFEQGFEAAAKTYAAASKKAAPTNSWRVYEVVAGMPAPTYLVFSTVNDYAEFDVAMKQGEAMMGAMSADDQANMQKWAREGMINSETQRFRVDPRQSYVNAETKAKDPAFWNPKPAARGPGQ